jgi:hypothetical protein
MARGKLNQQEWETFLALADRLEIDVRDLLVRDVPFHVLEAAGHALGRAVAQATTERLRLARAERLCEPQSCPTCGRQCPLVPGERPLETVDGPIKLHEPVCHGSACRRDFFPQRPALGLDQRTYSAAVVDKIVSANAEHKSTYKAQKRKGSAAYMIRPGRKPRTPA